MRKIGIVLALFVTTAAAARREPATKALSRELARLAAKAGGPVGVAAIAIESGERVSFAGRDRFPLAHRTGACGETDGVSACTNDVGTLPRGGHLAVAVFLKASPRDLVARERTIARSVGPFGTTGTEVTSD
jgi:hypothetical protein